MNLYEVIFYSSYCKTDGDEDTIYLVRAPDFMSAVEEVSRNASPSDRGGEKHPLARVVHEIGVDASSHTGISDARILRGPYIQCAYNYGWKSWVRKVKDGADTAEWKPYVEASPPSGPGK